MPIASLEGFLRQLIGWREFVRGIDRVHGQHQASSNVWNHQRRLAPCWDDGSTGLSPLDAAIERVKRLGYNHHIEWLMVLSLDSYEWVMGLTCTA